MPYRHLSTADLHLVINRGVDHQPIFFGDEDRLDFIGLLAATSTRYNIGVHAYCLTTTCFDLLVHSPPGVLSGAVQYLTGVFARHTNDRHHRDGPLFNGPFISIDLATRQQFLAASELIHRRSVDAYPQDVRDDDRWSSESVYLGRRRCPPFLDAALLRTMTGPARSVLGPLFSGSLRMTAADLRVAIRCAVAMRAADGTLSETRRRGAERGVLVSLLETVLDEAHAAVVVAAIGDLSADARRLAQKRARQLLEAEPGVRDALADIQLLLQPTVLAA